MGERERIIRERAELRASMVAELEALQTEADAGEMSPERLRTRLNEILARYVPEAAGEMRGDVDELVREYSELHDATARLRFLEGLRDSLGG